MVLVCFWTDFEAKPSILDPIQTIFDDLGPGPQCQARTWALRTGPAGGPAQAYFFTFFWPRDRSETLRSGPGMLLDQFSGQTVDSGPDSGHF